MNGRLVCKRLAEMGISDERLAADLGCSMSTVQKMKRGKSVRLETAIKAARYLGIGIEELTSPPKAEDNKAAS